MDIILTDVPHPEGLRETSGSLLLLSDGHLLVITGDRPPPYPAIITQAMKTFLTVISL